MYGDILNAGAFIEIVQVINACLSFLTTTLSKLLFLYLIKGERQNTTKGTY